MRGQRHTGEAEDELAGVVGRQQATLQSEASRLTANLVSLESVTRQRDEELSRLSVLFRSLKHKKAQRGLLDQHQVHGGLYGWVAGDAPEGLQLLVPVPVVPLTDRR